MSRGDPRSRVTGPELESRTIEAGPVGYRTKAFEGRRLVTFFLIAFGYSWFWWGLFVFDVLKMPAGVGTQDVEASPMLLLLAITPFGPTIAGFVVTAMTEGRAGVRRLWGRVWRDQRIGWLLVALTFYPALRFIANLVTRTLDGQAYPVLANASVWIFIPPLIANTLISGAMSEEFGWRGYVLPRFQARWNALISSVVLGVIWASWHIPLFFIPGDEHSQVFFWGWALAMIPTSVLITWVFNNANGSVLAAMLFHGAANASGDLFWCCGSSSWHFYGVELLAAVLIVVIFGPRTLVRRRPVPPCGR